MTTKQRINVTVRLRHSTWLIGRINVGTGVLPTGFHESGLPRTTPKGATLKGTYPDTYAYYDLCVKPDASLADAVNQANIWLRPMKEFTSEFVSSGGEIDYYITLSADAHFAEEFSVELMSECAALGVKVGFEIFLDKLF